MRRMLDPKEAGGSLPSTVKFDENGNRTVGKDLGVDGKLKLKSLVSASNPDGDITKELGGKLYKHTIEAVSDTYGKVYMTFYNYGNAAIDSPEKVKNAIASIGYLSATGYLKKDNLVYNVYYVYANYVGRVMVSGCRSDTSTSNVETYTTDIDYTFTVADNVKEVR